MKNYCMGIDIGGTSVKLGLFLTNGELADKWEIPTRREHNGERILGDIADSIRKTLAAKGIELSEVVGAGVGVPGPTLENGYVQVCVNLGWRDCNPAVELTSLLGIPVQAGNDANVAALGEMWKGGGEGYSDVVMLTLGTGVGGGIVMDGRIVAGKRGLAGEFGHITVNLEEEECCNCGNHGCLEQYASATGVVRVAKKLLEESMTASVLRETDVLTAKVIFDAARAKDALAVKAVDTLGRCLGQMLAMITMTIDPEVFVIGGGVSRAGSVLLDVITAYYERLTPLSQNKAPVVLAKLGNDAGIYGAARMVLD